MKEKQHITRLESPEQGLRRERRLQRREWAVKISQDGQKAREIDKTKKAAALDKARRLLKEEKKKKEPADKKPGAGTFLAAFSFIPTTPYDKRECVPSNYKPRSFNEKRQYVDFFKTYIYPYAVPLPLLWASFRNETTYNRKALHNVYYNSIMSLSKKWICDITSGESFYEKNKTYFTRAEAHQFLNTALPYSGPSSVLKLYFIAKCRARNIDINRSTMIANVFTIKFLGDWNNDIVKGFIDLLGRSSDYCIDAGTLGDLCDFILTKIIIDKKKFGKITAFSFSGRTMNSITALANEWHADLQKEQAMIDMLAEERHTHGEFPIKNNKIKVSWLGIDVPHFNYETEEYVWIIKQLLNAQALLNEGRTMRNCVSAYTRRCLTGNCALFNASYISVKNGRSASCATLEVDRNRTLMQAKGMCNMKVPPSVMKVIRKWAEANSIKISNTLL